MRPPLETRYALAFLSDLNAGPPWTLCAYRKNNWRETAICNTPDEAHNFFLRWRGSTITVLLGSLKPGTPLSREPAAASLAHNTHIALQIAMPGAEAGKPLPIPDALSAIRKPSMWLRSIGGAPVHGIAVWRFVGKADAATAARMIEDLARRLQAKGMDARAMPLMMPVPEMETGYRRGFFSRDDLINIYSFWEQPEKKPEAMLGDRGRALQSTLQDFSVDARVIGYKTGPVVTRFEVELGRGVKLSSVMSIAKDIARSMKCKSARIDEGEGLIGIELPNARREIVPLQDVLESAAFQNTEATLPLALGKGIDGSPVVADLAEMPHLLIAGASGKGKSVEINVIILSLIERFGPDLLSFILLDPKSGVELSSYNAAPHMLAPVVDDPAKSIRVLQWVVDEMERRYRAMQRTGARNLAGYNAKASARLAHIVVIVDEVADLMMTAGPEVEAAVQRLSQKARAAGIHLIMATQRPSADIIKGAIKANFPARIAFTVSSDTDSRVIIGQNGAEQLLGKGDMLYLSGGGDIARVHGAFVSDAEIEARVHAARARHGEPSYREDILRLLADEFGSGADMAVAEPTPQPPAYLDVYKTLTAAMQNNVRFLMTFFHSRMPATSERVLDAGKPWGVRDGGTLYRACDMLQIERRTNGNKNALWVPPTEWPDGFENVPIAIMA